MTISNQQQLPQNQARTQLKLTLQPTPAGLGHTLLYPALLMGGVAADANAAIVTVSGSPVSVSNDQSGIPWNITGSLTTIPVLSDCFGGGDNNFAPQLSNVDFMLTNVDENFVPVTAGMTINAASCNTVCATNGCWDELGSGGCCCNCLIDNAGGSLDTDAFGLFPSAGANFSGTLGMRFDNNGTTNYGAVNFTFSGCDGSTPSTCTLTFNSWSYENTGADYVHPVGAAPVYASSSSTLSLSLLGLALGVAGLRRRRELAVVRH